ncbi:hypothetical protein MRB53_021883 [Persea americana]|uniref:Uncharacterized protein n=1 Tax=Persea americana TaxID=3435 RepID=A0ACC2L556_PERAE|nr:hypothetical protein MRB53_021883 [Persea americana]
MGAQGRVRETDDNGKQQGTGHPKRPVIPGRIAKVNFAWVRIDNGSIFLQNETSIFLPNDTAGHFQYECPSKEKGANFAEAGEEVLLMAYVDNEKKNREDLWYLDSGCSNHMCGKNDCFSDLDASFRESVKLGNNSSMAVYGKGNIRLQVNGVVQIITGVFYVPELKNNLLSIGQFQQKGLTIVFQHGKCKIFHPERGLIMGSGMSSNRMFAVLAVSQPGQHACFYTVTEDQTHLWHCRYGHLNFQGLRTLHQKQMVKGLPQLKTPSKVCKDCLVGKQHGNSFPKVSTWRASQILQLIHADICGPITPISNSKKRSPTFAVKNQTPEEAWSGVKPSVEYFKRIEVGIGTRNIRRQSLMIWNGEKMKMKKKVLLKMKKKVLLSENEEEGVAKNEEEVFVDLNNDTGGELNGGRNRRPPVSMEDYETGEGFSEEDDGMAQFVMFAAADPIKFEEAVVWLRRIMEMLGKKQNMPTIVHYDSSSAIKLAKNPIMHGHSKHIDVRFHFLRKLTKAGTVEMVHCNSQDQAADMMTKPLKLDAFLKLRRMLGVCLEPCIN